MKYPPPSDFAAGPDQTILNVKAGKAGTVPCEYEDGRQENELHVQRQCQDIGLASLSKDMTDSII